MKVQEEKKQRKKGANAPEDEAAKCKRKIEKLRKQLEKEENRIAKAEAQVSRHTVELGTEVIKTDVLAVSTENKKRKRSDSGGSGDGKIEITNLAKPKLQEAASIVPDPLTPTSQPALADEERNIPHKAVNADGAPGQVNSPAGQESDGNSFSAITGSIEGSSVSVCDSSSDCSSTDSADITSSSGSTSDNTSDDEAPDETSTKRNGPETVAPPKRSKSRQICRGFLHNGLCKRGRHCRYLHELPERGSRGVGSQEVKRAEGRKQRVGLYQRVSGHIQRKI